MNKLILLFAFLLLLSCTAEDSKPKNVLIIGDSISIGYTPHVVEMLKGTAVVKRHKGNAGPTLRGLEQIDSWLGDGKKQPDREHVELCERSCQSDRLSSGSLLWGTKLAW